MEFMIKRANPEDFSAIIHLILDVHEKMPEDKKVWFVVDSEEETRRLLETGQVWAYTAVEAESRNLAGVFIAAFPGLAEHNLGYDIGFEKDKLLQVAHMETAAVDSAYRGYRLQKRLMEYAEEDLRRAGYRYLCCTVHPENRYSKNNVLAQGYQVMVTKEKYGGFLRDILMKEL